MTGVQTCALPIYYALTVGFDGPGSVFPLGTRGYSEDSMVELTYTADTGARFVRWDGANGNEVSGNMIKMTGDKSVIAIFEADVILLEDAVVPEAPPEATSIPEPTVVVTPEAVISEPVLDETIPQDVPALPKTSGIPIGLLVLAGTALTTAGSFLRRNKKK